MANSAAAGTVVPTLPDLLAAGLDVVFVSINPSIYSAERGRYFARRSNKFWPCVSRSQLTLRARTALGVAVLGPEHDAALLRYGIGFTDLVKRPTARAADLAPGELAAGVEAVVAKLARYRPRVACFHGVTGYRHVHEALTGGATAVVLGPQAVELAVTRVFVAPNPSGANAHFSREEQTQWYDRLAAFVAGQPPEAPGERRQAP